MPLSTHYRDSPSVITRVKCFTQGQLFYIRNHKPVPAFRSGTAQVAPTARPSIGGDIAGTVVRSSITRERTVYQPSVTHLLNLQSLHMHSQSAACIQHS